jgi:nitroreductase
VTLHDALRTRPSIRRFEHHENSDDMLDQVLDLARHAPSSMDGQPCCFVVVRDSGIKARIVALKNAACPPGKSAFPADFLLDAPVVVAVCVDRRKAHDRLRENGVLVTGHLLLAAHAAGLGGVYLSAYESHGDTLSRELAALLQLPESVEPVTLVPLGFPAETPRPKALRPLEELVHHDGYEGTG